MDFFNAQDKARRHTLRLILLFAAAVLALVVLTNLLVTFVLLYSQGTGNYRSAGMTQGLFSSDRWVSISLAVLVVVSAASLYKYMMVKSGGRAIAESLGGRLLEPNNPTPGERRLLNVVEEMAIAAGISVPPVYLIPDPAINAFAAGFGVEDAVIGVTEGCVKLLNRDELQGVIGHEFSHLFNGDSRINLRLIAILHGILFIGIVGGLLLRSAAYGGTRMSSRRSSNNSVPLLLLGVGLLIIGYAGTFFGNLIKAAVSRQREFLADAASVQFTRNPGGIANALKKIGGYSQGSILHEVRAQQLSHMFFGQGVALSLGGLMATHPPLEARIRAVEPSWDGRLPRLELGATAAEFATDSIDSSEAGATFAVSNRHALAPTEVATATQALQASELTQSIGQPTQAHLTTARTLIDSTATLCQEAAHDPWGARALLYAMLLSDADSASKIVRQRAQTGVPEYMAKLRPSVRSLDYQQRLMLLSMAVPTLKRLSLQQYQTFIVILIELIKADHKIDLFEWVMHRILLKELKPHFEQVSSPRARYRNLGQVEPEVIELFSSLARLEDTPEAARSVFQKACDVAGLHGSYIATDDPNFSRLNAALAKLRQIKPLGKPKLITACATILLQSTNEKQLSLMQGIAATLDCPLPPALRNSPQ